MAPHDEHDARDVTAWRVTVGILGVGLVVLFGIQTWLDRTALYAWSVFLVVPFVLGMCGAAVIAITSPAKRGRCLAGAVLALPFGGAFLLATGFEGLICIAMALPVALVPAVIGGLVVYHLRRRRENGAPTRAEWGCLVALPLAMASEAMILPEAPMYEVSTAIEIDAPREVVWDAVIAFPPLDPPTEWWFRAGIAAPIGASIEGEGVGAIRRCEFTTGAFVEPIEVWDAPRELAFRVTENPPPMAELNPFHDDVHPPHLAGFLVAERGKFVLEETETGGTRLVGTTWYRHGLWPGPYWRLWSDAILHRVHRRVLEHVARTSQAALVARGPSGAGSGGQ